jgi:hypothetical protein
MPAILDVAIGLTFVFLLFSLVVTAANEIWLSFLDQRTRFLRQGLRDLFHEYQHEPLPGWLRSLRNKLLGKPEAPPTGPSLLGEFYEHGLINALSKGRGERPTYIAPGIFVTALLDLLAAKGGSKSPDRVKRLQAGIAKIAKENPHLAQSLKALLTQASGNLDAFRSEIETWFNDSMDRVTGWYKRYSQQWLLCLGLGLAIVCNVDSVHIIRVLSIDPNLRKAIVDQAQTYASDRAKASPPGQAAEPGDPTKTAPSVAAFKDAVGAMGGLALPIGWDGAQVKYFTDDDHWLAALAGWLVTAIAASLGAPFWFDTLQRFINIRGNGRAPEEKKLATKAAS